MKNITGICNPKFHDFNDYYTVDSEYESKLIGASDSGVGLCSSVRKCRDFSIDQQYVLNGPVKMNDLPIVLKDISSNNHAGCAPYMLNNAPLAAYFKTGDKLLLISVMVTGGNNDSSAALSEKEDNDLDQGGSILSIKKVKMDDEYFYNVIGALKDANLHEIVVRSCSLSANALASAFSQLDFISNLTKVDISGNILNNDGVAQVLKSLIAQPVTVLRLLGTGISGHNIHDLTESLRLLPLLEKLNISKNDFSTSDGIIYLVDKLQVSRIKELKLADTGVNE